MSSAAKHGRPLRLGGGVGLGRDASLLIAGQAARAAGYGFTAVLLGALLAERGYGHLRAGVVLTALIAGTALSSLDVGALADRAGRRRSYAVFFLGIAAAGVVVAADAPFWVLLLVALTGTLSTDVVDNGPATTLEQTMLAADDAGTARVYGLYNAVGAVGGALGALAAALPGLAGGVSGWWFAVLVPVGLLGAALAWQLSSKVEATAGRLTLADAVSARSRLGPSRRVVHRLAGLFAVDAAGGGLVTTGFLAYYLSQRYGVSVTQLGWLFFCTAGIQAVSVTIAPRLASRFGLVATMVGTHLPSNVLLAAVAFAPPFRRGCFAAGPHLSVADGRAHPAGAGDDGRHPRRAHDGRGGDQRRPLHRPPDRPAHRRRRRAARARRAAAARPHDQGRLRPDPVALGPA